MNLRIIQSEARDAEYWPIDIIYYLIEAKSISLLEEEQPGGEHSKAKGYNSHSFVIPQRYR